MVGVGQKRGEGGGQKKTNQKKTWSQNSDKPII
jgi:hypothetical protein